MLNKQKPIKIYSKRIAYEMRIRGFKCIGTIPNPKYPQCDIYLFDNTTLSFQTFQQLTAREADVYE